MRITEEREQAVLNRMKRDLKEARPNRAAFWTWKEHKSWMGAPWGRRREAITAVNRFWARLFGSASRAHRYGSYIRTSSWCGEGAALAAEKAYLAGAQEAIALLRLDGRSLDA